MNERIEYPEILRAIGHFIVQEHLSDVTITEFDRGWVIVGLTFKSTSGGFIRVPADFVLAREEVIAMARKLREEPKVTPPQKRGWWR
jgi:hypothetical protein